MMFKKDFIELLTDFLMMVIRKYVIILTYLLSLTGPTHKKSP